MITRNDLKAEVTRRGYTLRSWSLQQGYDPNLVQRIVSDWPGKSTAPRIGTKTEEIIGELESLTGLQIWQRPKRKTKPQPKTA